MKKRILALFMAFCLIFVNCIDVYGQEKNILLANDTTKTEESNLNGKDESIISSSSAPSGYVPQEEGKIVQKAARIKALDNIADEGKKVLLVQDVLPWNQKTNEIVLSSLGIEYDKVTTQNFLSIDLSMYDVVIFANDQKFSAYENYEEFKEYMELFASVGGVIIFGACDMGWSDGSMTGTLPGGIGKGSDRSLNNYIEDYTHPIVTGELTDGGALKDEDLYENWTSHTYFSEDTLPAGSKVILRSSNNDMPTLVEYPLGIGRVIASALTWEFNYNYGGQSHPNGGNRGKFARNALGDMFTYAVKVSKISVDDISILQDYFIEKNSYSILVSSSETMEPIEGATVTIAGSEYTTDEKGMVKYKNINEVQTITANASGYRKNSQLCKTTLGGVTYIFLDAKIDNLPYVTLASEIDNYFDLRTRTLHYTEGSTEMCNLKVEGDFGTHGTGTYILYQEGEEGVVNGKSITRSNGSFFFAPGTVFNPEEKVKLKMVAADGVESTPININIEIDKKIEGNNGGGIEDMTSFDVCDPVDASLNNDNVTAIFPGDYNLKFSSLPVSVKKVTNIGDGSYTVRMSIGLGTSNWLDKDSKWDSYKKDFNTAAKNTDRANKLAELTQAYGKLSGGFTVAKNISWGMSSVGYYEWKYDKNGSIMKSEGGLLMNLDGKATYSQQFLLGPVPVYFDITGGVNFAGSVGIKFLENSEHTYTGSIKITPSIAIGGGVGVKGVATVGVEGGAKLKIDITPNSKGTIIPEAKIKMYLLWIFDFEYTIWKGDFVIWDDQAKQANNAQRALSPRLSEFNLSSRTYVDKTTEWSGAVDNDSKSYKSLQDWIMPNTIPQMKEVNDKFVMVFQHNDAERDDANSVVLMYSVFENHIWSEPKAVWDTGTNDLYSQLTVIDDEVYLVWQKQKSETQGETVEEMIKNVSASSEICFAKFDSANSEFTDTKYITNDSTLDMYPRIAGDSDNLSITWVSNDENDVLGKSGTYSIMNSNLENNKWSTPTELYQTTDYITELTTDYIDNEHYTSFISEKGNEADGYLISDSGVKEVIPDDANASAVTFTEDKLYWNSNGVVYEYDPITGNISEIKAGGESVITSSYDIVSNSNTTAITWISVSDEGYDIMASIKTEDGWGNPIVLLENANSIQFMNVELDEENWKVIMNTMKTVGNENIYSLVYSEINPKTDLVLEDCYANDEDRVDGIQPINLNVTNTGFSTVNEIKVQAYNGTTNYLDKTIYCKINPGETVDLTENMDLSGISSETPINIAISAKEETNLTDNNGTITLGLTDVSVEVTTYKIGSKLFVTSRVANNTDTIANSAISISEDKEDGITLDMRNIGEINNTSDYMYTYVIDTDKIEFGETGAKYYYVKVDTKEADSNEYNNMGSIIVYKDVVKASSLNPIQEVEINDVIDISLDKSEIMLGLKCNDHLTQQLNAILTPTNATYPLVSWKSSDESVATVDNLGNVTAVSKGTATITATTVDGGYSADCIVKVFDDHMAGDVEVEDATCTKEGTEQTKCIICGTVLDTTIITAIDHKFGEWTIVKEATETDNGEKVRNCSICGLAETAIIQKLERTAEVNQQTVVAENQSETVTTQENQVNTGDNNQIALIILATLICLSTLVISRKKKINM